MLCVPFVHVWCLLGAWWVWSGGDPHPLAPLWWQRKAVQVFFYSATLHNLLRHTTILPPPCKHPEGRWVGRRWRGVLSMWTVCPHPPRQHNTQHGTSPPPPAASAEPRRGARPARRAGGSTAADCEVGGAQFSRDTNANSWQLFCRTVKVVESCGKFSSETN